MLYPHKMHIWGFSGDEGQSHQAGEARNKSYKEIEGKATEEAMDWLFAWIYVRKSRCLM